MTFPELIAWIVTWPALLDATPLHSPIRRPKNEPFVIARAATDFVDARTAKGLASADVEFYAAFLDVFGARESGYHTDKAGDCPGMKAGDPACTLALGAAHYGAWQTPSAETPKTAASPELLAMAQAKLALKHFQNSIESCPDHPLSLYMSGKCSPIGGAREAEMKAALATAKPPSPIYSSPP